MRATSLVLLLGALGVALLFTFYDTHLYSSGDALQIISADPADGAGHVSRFTTLSVVFNNPLDQFRTTAAFTLMSLSGTVVPGVVSYGPPNTFRFAPGQLYEPSQVLSGATAYVMSFVGATDIHGGRLDASILFTTTDGSVRQTIPSYDARSNMFFASWASSISLPPAACRAVFCVGRAPSRNRFSPDFPCPGGVFASAIWNSTASLRFNMSGRLEYGVTSFFVFPYGAKTTWPCVDLSTGMPVPPVAMNFTLARRIPLRVESIYPPSDARDVSRDVIIAIRFSKPMNRGSVENSFSLLHIGTGRVFGSFSWPSASELTFRPSSLLAMGASFLVAISDGRDTENENLPAFSSIFQTVDGTPSVVSIFPPYDAVVPTNVKVNITFSVPMNVSSVGSGFSLLVIGGGRSSGTLRWHNRNTVLVYTPSTGLPRFRSFLVVIIGGRSEGGDEMPDFSSSFHTGDPSPPPPPPARPRVLILGADDDDAVADVQLKLQHSGRFSLVDCFRLQNSTPALSLLQDYNATLVFTSYAPADPGLFSSVLAAYVNGAGKVLAMVFSLLPNRVGPSWTDVYQVIVPAEMQVERVLLGNVTQPGSPIMRGVTRLDGGPGSFRANSRGTNPESTVVANWSDGTILAAQRFVRGTCRIDINLYPPSSSVRSDFWVHTTDGAVLMANALEYLAENCGEQALRSVSGRSMAPERVPIRIS